MDRTLIEALWTLINEADNLLDSWLESEDETQSPRSSLQNAVHTVRQWLSTETAPPPHIQAYVDTGGIHCPYCESDQLTGHSLDLEAGHVWLAASCQSCDRRWEEQYTLAGVREITPPPQRQQPASMGD